MPKNETVSRLSDLYFITDLSYKKADRPLSMLLAGCYSDFHQKSDSEKERAFNKAEDILQLELMHCCRQIYSYYQIVKDRSYLFSVVQVECSREKAATAFKAFDVTVADIRNGSNDMLLVCQKGADTIDAILLAEALLRLRHTDERLVLFEREVSSTPRSGSTMAPKTRSTRNILRDLEQKGIKEIKEIYGIFDNSFFLALKLLKTRFLEIQGVNVKPSEKYFPPRQDSGVTKAKNKRR